MLLDILTLVAVGFVAQLVDGALGMAFGLISTTALLTLGLPPAQASAAVHTAEVATTGVSGLAHLIQRNIEPRLFLTLGIAGMVGGVAGAWLLSNIDGRAIRPFIAGYLLLVGMLVLLKASRPAPAEDAPPRGVAAPLGVVGGFLDAIGGGGWGAIVTSTLIGSGHAPRKVIGSVNAAEFFVTVAISTTFLLEMGVQHLTAIASLVVGGVLAAPFGAILVRYAHPRALMAAVGTLVCVLSVIQLVQALG